jgi:hypothetical protein
MTPTRSGNALLIAILLTSILILITVGLSRLVSSETRQISDLIRNGRAEYLAEGGSELGQLIYYNADESTVYEFDKNYTIELGTTDQPKTLNFTLQSTTNHIPILSPEVFNTVKENPLLKNLLFQPLLPGESVEIFLTENVDAFEIQYYIPSINPEILGSQFSQADLDVLLFKLSGVTKTEPTDNFKINFITEYFPAGRNENNPKIIGTTEGVYNNGNYFDYSSGEQNQNFNPSVGNNGQLTFDKFEQPRKNFKEFLVANKNNVISLTNAVNLATINPLDSSDLTNYNKLQEALGSIYFRVCSPSCDSAENPDNSNTKLLVSPFVVINSTATYQGTTKNLTTQLTRPNAFSVFDFAIYQTGTSTNE